MTTIKVDNVLLNFINGQFVSSSGSDFIDNFEPATGEILSKVRLNQI